MKIGIVLLVSLVLFGCDTSKEEFKDAMLIGTASAFKDYYAKYPNTQIPSLEMRPLKKQVHLKLKN